MLAPDTLTVSDPIPSGLLRGKADPRDSRFMASLAPDMRGKAYPSVHPDDRAAADPIPASPAITVTP
ncbi:hypothetical protein ATE59_02470 [Sphingopyxis sp. A083]|jgi:hypothetical protein|nr:hypothetical protein ATE59_02470 [Sphingopyxis sp. A083]